MKKRPKNKTTDYEQLGRMIEQVFEHNYANRRRLYVLSFFKGVFVGLGSVVGATIVVAVIVWVLGLFSGVPVINIFTENVRDTVQR